FRVNLNACSCTCGKFIL
ncbi:SWIM zinc finger family protein, partial [Rhizobium ruizarguesonis]